MRIPLLVCFPLLAIAVSLNDLSEFGTPGSKLLDKCVAYPATTAMHHQTCYVRDPTANHTFDAVKSGKVICNHFRGFNAEIPKYKEKLAHWLLFEKLLNKKDQTFFSDRPHHEGRTSSGSVICRYNDFFSCSNGYVQHRTHCFKVFANQVKWGEAQSFCRKQGASLAVPHDDETLKYLSKLAYNKNITNKMFNSLFWIGLQISDHKTLKTADGTPADHFRWLPLGHKRPLTAAYKTPNTAVALASSAANTGHVGVFGYNQVINGNYHKLPFICGTPAKNFGQKIYVPHSII